MTATSPILQPVPCYLLPPDPAPTRPVSYSFIKNSLGGFGDLRGLYDWFKGQGYTLPLSSPKAFILKMVALVKSETFFPAHEVELEEYTDEVPNDLGAFSEQVPFLSFVHLCGLELDQDWGDWSELYKFCFCLTLAVDDLTRLDFFSLPYEDYVANWWEKHATEYDLPPLDEVNSLQVLARIEDLPEPYNGLGAILTWIDADTGNPFVDLSCNEIFQGGYNVDWDWDAETLDYLFSSYAEAERDIFGPADFLDKMVARDPRMLRTCIDLALGRCNALVWDGELIVMDPDVSLTGMPADMTKLHVDPWVRRGLELAEGGVTV